MKNPSWLSLLILASVLLLAGCEKTASRFHPNGVKSETYGFKVRSNPVTGAPDTVRWGKALEWGEDGRLFSQLNYKAGKLDGPAFDFYETGEVRVRFYYSNGKLDSTVLFLPNGKIRERMVAGVERDTVITYDSLGNAIKRLRLDAME
jgi:antitoxin component YwqK of YwqJK toxin-antitoxin module